MKLQFVYQEELKTCRVLPFYFRVKLDRGTKYGVDLSLQDSLSGALVDHNVGHGEKTPMGSESYRVAVLWDGMGADLGVWGILFLF